MECVAIPIPSLEKLDFVASCLSPLVAVCKRRVKTKDNHAECQKDNCPETTNERILAETNTWDTSSDIIVSLAKGDNRKVKSWEVVVQKQLTLHQVEWKVVESPSENHSTDFVIKTLKDSVAVVVEAALPSEDSQTFEDDIEKDGNSRRPPDKRVANEIDLTVILAPEVDATAQDGPGWGARIPSVRLDKTGIGVPHDLLQFPELTKETWIAIVDLFCSCAKLRMLVLLNIPDAIGKSTALRACYFLLLRCPIWKLDFV